MEARIEIALAEEKLRLGLATLGLNNHTNPNNTPKSLAENKFLIHSQAKQQGNGLIAIFNDDGIIATPDLESAKANTEKGDYYIEQFSLFKHSGSREDTELGLRLLEIALENYRKAVDNYSHLVSVGRYQDNEDTISLSYGIQMVERIRDFHLRPAVYRFGDSSLASSHEYIRHVSPIMIKAFNKGLEILNMLLVGLERAEEIQREQEEKFKQNQSTRMLLPASGQQFLANTVSSSTKELLFSFQENKQPYEKFEANANRVSFSIQRQVQHETKLENALHKSDIIYLQQEYKRLNHQLEYLDYVSNMDNTNTVLTSSINKRVRDDDNDNSYYDGNNSSINEIEKRKIETHKMKKTKTQINSIAPNNKSEKPDSTSMQIQQHIPFKDPEISEYSLFF